jgi:hypothetical protein
LGDEQAINLRTHVVTTRVSKLERFAGAWLEWIVSVWCYIIWLAGPGFLITAVFGFAGGFSWFAVVFAVFLLGLLIFSNYIGIGCVPKSVRGIPYVISSIVLLAASCSIQGHESNPRGWCILIATLLSVFLVTVNQGDAAETKHPK